MDIINLILVIVILLFFILLYILFLIKRLIKSIDKFRNQIVGEQGTLSVTAQAEPSGPHQPDREP